MVFDLGDLTPLSTRDLLKVTHIFITHAHVDHFIGFDTLLRISLGREKELHLFGPPDFFKRVEGKLAGYTWNLVDEYETDLVLHVSEVHARKLLTRTYSCKDHFHKRPGETAWPFSKILLEEPSFHVEAELLDHRVPCLGFSLVEHFYVNIVKEGLKELGLGVGPWLTRFKRALYEKQDPSREFTVTWEQGGPVLRERRFPLGELAEKIARISPGRKITYITDIIGSPENVAKVLKLADHSDHLFIEASFLDCDRDLALRKYHLTAKEAGDLARRARVRQYSLFHYSPRYMGRGEELEREAGEAFRG